jgi:hypothetical protein
MKDILEQILGYLPKYLPEFLRVFAGPKSAISERNQGKSDDLKQALIFFGISFFLIFPFQRALIPNQQELWTHIAQSVAIALFFGLASAALIRLAWRIVGGSAPLENFVVVYCYSFGILLVIIMFCTLIPLGALKTFYPDSYTSVKMGLFSAHRSPFDFEGVKDLYLVPGYWLYFMLNSLLFLLPSVWYVIAWGAYRELTRQTKARSVAAFILSLIFLLPVGMSSTFVGRLFM